MLRFLHDHNPLINLGVKTWHLVIFMTAGIAAFSLAFFVRHKPFKAVALGLFAVISGIIGLIVELHGTFTPAWLVELILAACCVIAAPIVFEDRRESKLPTTVSLFYGGALLLAGSLQVTIATGAFVRDLAGYTDGTARSLFITYDILWGFDFVLLCTTVLIGVYALIFKRP